MLQESSQSPPSKANLKAWWNHFTFTQRVKKESEGKGDGAHVFSKPLKESLQYASVQISTANANGELYVWGYIPVVVAKCGLYLKENATEVEGTFRVPGSAKRMRELQAAFETPPKYGKSLDWKQEQYTTHDVASVFRRYLTQMPEPVIPYDMYHDFRDALAKEPFNHDSVITTYKQLIRGMPRPNQYLLLYVLDLLSVFARKSEKNLMNATNLAVIFRPGLISHPNHDLSPGEQALSQKVLEFLIAQQDWFMLEVPHPPQSEPGSPISPRSPDFDDITVFPSSDEDQPESNGWRLIGRDHRTRVARRRTTLDRTADSAAETSSPPLEGSLSPVDENATPPRPEDQGATVTRRRTLPSSRKAPPPTITPTTTTTTTATAERARVLKKQKRASSSQPSRSKADIHAAA